MPHFFFL